MTFGHSKKAFYAQGRLKTGEMNKSEGAYALQLKAQLNAGEILWYKFEGIKLRLADNTFLTVDFAVLAKDYVLEMREVKGHWMEDARAKMKIAADLYPFRFKAFKARAKKDGGGWEEESFSRGMDTPAGTLTDPRALPHPLPLDRGKEPF